jgi:chromosome condensin MukBEF complex kleisin-like MukF subunit
MQMKVYILKLFLNIILSEIKEERLVEYTQGLVGELKSTNRIIAFTKILRVYMPKYNELKHFNAQRIVSSFMEGTYNKMQNT